MATSIRLAPETEQRREFLATSTGHTKAYYLRKMIDNGLPDMEDYYLAAEVLERARKGQESVRSAADVRKGTWSGRLNTPIQPKISYASSLTSPPAEARGFQEPLQLKDQDG